MFEIKVRAWDKELEKFHDEVVAIDFRTKMIMVYSKSEDMYPSGWLPLDRFELTQYTEVNDKNGKEIYEGDVFRTSLGHVAVVEWEDEGRFLGFTIDRSIVYLNREPAVEVIGNIYKNPELLTA